MGLIGKLAVSILGDDKEIKRTFNTLEKRSRKLEKSMYKTARSFNEIGRSMTTFITGPIVALGTAFAKSAMDLEATEAKYNTVFGNMTEEADAFIKKFQQLTPATTSSARSMASGIQDLLIPMGFAREEATKMTGEFYHAVGALTNFNSATHSAADVTNAMQSAITGQFRPLKSLGIQLDITTIKQKAVEMGLAKTTEEVTKQDQAQVLLSEVYAQSGDALAAYTEENLDAKTKLGLLKAEAIDLTAEFGEVLLPIINDFIDRMREGKERLKDLVTWFKNLNPEMQTNLLKWAGIAAIVGPLLLVFGQMVTTLKSLIPLVKGLNAAWLLLGPEGTVAVAVILGLGAMILKIKKMREETKLLKADLDDLAKSQLEARRALLEKQIKDLEKQIDKAIENQKERERAELGVDVVAIDALEMWQDMLAEAQDNLRKTNAELDKFNQKTSETTDLTVSDTPIGGITTTEEDEFKKRQERLTEIYNQKIVKMEQAEIDRIANNAEEWRKEQDAFKENQLRLTDIYNSTISEWEQAEIDRIANRVAMNVAARRREKEEFEASQLRLTDIYNTTISNWEQAEIDRIAARMEEWRKEKEEFQRHQNELDKIYNDKIEAWEQAEIDRIANRMAEWRKEQDAQEETLTGFGGLLQQIGFSAEEVTSSFEGFKESIVDGLTNAITKGEDFMDTLKNIADQIAAMVVKRGVVEPFVDLLFSLGSAHTGALVTTVGLARDLPSYHTGGTIGLRSDERLIKAQTGERILSRGQNAAFESGEFGKTEVINNFNINAVDAASFAEMVRRNPDAITGVVANDFQRNGVVKRVIKGGG